MSTSYNPSENPYTHIGVPFNYNRGNPIPLDNSSIFTSLTAAIDYAKNSPVAYNGQVIAVNEDEEAAWTESITSADAGVTLTAIPSYVLEFSNNTWTISCANGFTNSMLKQILSDDTELSPGSQTLDATKLVLTTAEGNLTVPENPSLVGNVEIDFVRDAATVNTWNLYIVDSNLSDTTNLKKIEGGSGSGGGGSSGDVQAEEARAKAVENALSAQISVNTAGIAAHQLSIEQISADLTVAEDALTSYLPLSGGQVTGELSIGNARLVDTNTAAGFDVSYNDESYQFGGAESKYQVARKSDLSVYVLSSQLSNAMAGNLSSANAANPVMLSSDLSALVEKAIKFKGAVSTSAALPSADVDIGDMYIITGDGDDAGAEFVCTSLSGDPVEPVWSELGREGTITALWEAVNTLSNTTIPTICTDLSNAITANAGSITAISDVIENGISAAIEGITADIDTLSNTTIPQLCTAISNAVTSVSGDLISVSSDIYTPGTGLSAQVTSVSSTVLTVQNDVASLRTDVNGISTDIYNEGGISSQISTLSGAVSSLVNDQVSITIDDLSSTKLNVKHISEADYHQLVVDGRIDPKTIYIVSADGYQNMYGERITNLSTVSTDLSSAANVSFVTAYVGDQMATVNGDVKYLSNAITAITADITAITSDIDQLSGQIGSLSGAMVSAVVISAETRAISADVKNGIATISGLSVSDLAWDISVINGGDSGYVPQT